MSARWSLHMMLVICVMITPSALAAQVVFTPRGSMLPADKDEVHASNPGGLAAVRLMSDGLVVGSGEVAQTGMHPADSESDVAIRPGRMDSEKGQRSHAHQEVLTGEFEQAFDEFLALHGRKYSRGSQEYDLRQNLFNKRLTAVRAQNARPHGRWKAATTRFSDFTEDERAVMRGYRGRMNTRGHSSVAASALENARSQMLSLPENVDWRHLSVSNDIADQGACGSCWAIATASVLEAHYEIYTAKGGDTRTFSVQQTLACTPNPEDCGGNGGCGGATVELGMDWILKNGVTTDENQPYLAEDSACKSDDSSSVLQKGKGVDDSSGNLGAAFGLLGWQTLESNADYPLAEAVAKYGPVAVSAAASNWYEYSSGIFDSCDGEFIVDHAIVLYGYGQANGEKYWLLRNSWGKEWGEEGFMRILRYGSDADQHCGADTDPSQGVGCKGGPSTVTVCGSCGILYDSVVPHFAGAPLASHSSSGPEAMVRSVSDSDSQSNLHEAADAMTRIARREVPQHRE